LLIVYTYILHLKLQYWDWDLAVTAKPRFLGVDLRQN
jgi:hypothetical protein